MSNIMEDETGASTSQTTIPHVCLVVSLIFTRIFLSTRREYSFIDRVIHTLSTPICTVSKYKYN